MRTVIQKITCVQLTALYRSESETGAVELLLVPAGMEAGVIRGDCAAEPLVQVHLAQDDAPAFFSGGRTMRGSAASSQRTEIPSQRSICMKNPILPGFHPDASAVQVGDDYYIATSTIQRWRWRYSNHRPPVRRWRRDESREGSGFS